MIEASDMVLIGSFAEFSLFQHGSRFGYGQDRLM
jgi:hypothetical protein